MAARKRKRDQTRPGAWRGRAIAAIAVAILGGGVWWLSQNISGVNRPDNAIPTVNLLPPPPPAPPPPPPPPEKPPEPDKVVQTPKDQTKADDQPKQLTIAGPAQAGGDAFGVRAGSGGGSSLIGGDSGGGGSGGGGGFEEASYQRFLSVEIQQAVQANPHIDRAFGTADVAVWVSSNGHVTRAKLRRSTGNDKIDAELVATLEHMRPLSDLPPASFKFPREIKVRGARG